MNRKRIVIAKYIIELIEATVALGITIYIALNM